MAADPQPSNLHEHAIQALRHLSALSTGLAAAGAPPDAVKAVGEAEKVVQGVAKVLGSPDPNPPQANVSPEPDAPPGPGDPAGGPAGPDNSIGAAVQQHMMDRNAGP